MKRRKITVRDLLTFLDDSMIRVVGDAEGAYIDNMADVKHVSETTLDWVLPRRANKQEIAEQSKAKVMLVDPEVEYSEKMKSAGKVLIVVRNPKLALAQIGNAFFVEKYPAEVHPTAIIAPEAEIGEGVYIGPYTVIGKAKIGEGCVIESNVRIYDDVTLGRGCRIKPGAVIGGEGFGFERDSEGNKFRFPQIGRVVLGDDVEVGANACIDRGALSDTVIGDHTKINNLCHIAHNNQIGRNVTIAGCVNVSGSNVIDDDVWIAPHACIRGYIHLGQKCVIGMGAIVTKDVPAGETWVGNPARKMEKK